MHIAVDTTILLCTLVPKLHKITARKPLKSMHLLVWVPVELVLCMQCTGAEGKYFAKIMNPRPLPTVLLKD